MDFYAVEGTPTFLEEFQNTKVRNVACSDRHTVMCTEDGKLFVWGDSVWFNPTDFSSMVMERKIVQVAAGHKFSLAIDGENFGFSMRLMGYM
jgi:alpha-tubulin suppressor-like RCC1 family protein